MTAGALVRHRACIVLWSLASRFQLSGGRCQAAGVRRCQESSVKGILGCTLTCLFVPCRCAPKWYIFDTLLQIPSTTTCSTGTLYSDVGIRCYDSELSPKQSEVLIYTAKACIDGVSASRSCTKRAGHTQYDVRQEELQLLCPTSVSNRICITFYRIHNRYKVLHNYLDIFGSLLEGLGRVLGGSWELLEGLGELLGSSWSVKNRIFTGSKRVSNIKPIWVGFLNDF